MFQMSSSVAFRNVYQKAFLGKEKAVGISVTNGALQSVPRWGALRDQEPAEELLL